MPANIEPNKKVLILRFSSIGDIVLTSPVVRCLKQQTNFTIHYLVKEKFADTLRHNPHIDKLFTFKESISEVIDQLKEEKYDHIVDLHKNLRTRKLKALLRRPSTSFKKLNIAKWLLVNTKINTLPDTHIVDRYLNTISNLGVKNDGKGLDYFLSDSDKVDLTAFGLKPDNYTAVGIAAAHNTKRLSPDKLEQLLANLKGPIVLLGGPTEAEMGKQFERDNIINLCGKLSLNQSAFVIQLAKLIITHDTGLMHMAAAFKKNCVSIWGNTVPAFGMYPYYGNENVNHLISEVQGLGCRPCSKIGYNKCPKGHFKCMQNQDIDFILNWVDQM